MDRITIGGGLSASEFSQEIAAYSEALNRKIESAVEGFSDSPDDRAARRKKSVNDFQFFSQTYFPHYSVRDPADVHRYLYEKLPAAVKENRGVKIAVAAPRGEGKSTIVSLQFLLWAAIFKRKKYIVLIGDVYAQAATLLAAVKSEAESNPRLATDYPKDVGIGPMWRESRIVLRGGTKIHALGSGQKIRGLRHGPHRPDLIVADDLENDEHVRTLEQRRKLRAWFSAAVRHAGPPDGSMDTIVVGTVLHYDSLLAGLLASASWHRRKFAAIEQWPDRMDLWDRFSEIAAEEGDAAARAFYAARKSAMDAGAKTSWPAARALIDIMLARAEDPVSFATEQQNSPSASPDAVFAGSLQYWSRLPADLLCFGAVDPSLGKKGGGADPSAVLVGGLDRAARGRRALHVIEARIGRRKPAEIIALIIDLQRQYQCFVWAVESVQFQEFFRDRLIEKSTEDGIPVPAVAVQPNTDKRLRIESLQPHVDNGLILLDRQHKTLIDQLEHYPHVAHDDGPDALHMLWSIAVSRGMGGEIRVRSRPRPNEERIDWKAYA